MTAAIAALLFAAPLLASAQSLSPQQRLARDIHKELVEINRVTATGDTAKAAEAMAARLRSAGFPAADVQVFTPAPRKGNLVARLRGSGAQKPIMLLAHIDVVEAKREDWSLDPFKLTEKDGYFYGPGTADDKFMAAAFVANLIRYRQEGFKPNRDLIVVLSTDEEIGDANNLGIRWLLANHRELIEAEFALNEGAGVGLKSGKPLRHGLQTSETVPVNCRVLPGEPIEEVESTLRRVLADEQISLTRSGEFRASPPSPLRPDIVQPIEQLSAQFWPGIPVIPSMSAGATDGSYLRNAGIPTYGHSGLASDVDDVRIHGRDERVGVQAFDDGLEYLYRLVKLLSQ